MGILMLLAAYVSPASAVETSETRLTEITFQRMAVAPVLVGHRRPNMNEVLDDTLSCPLDEICANDPTILPDAGPRMAKMLQNALEKRFGHHMVDQPQVRAAYSDILLDGARDTPRTMVTRLGKSLSADLVLVTTLWRYRERSTREDGFPDRPASVAFALYLVDPASGRRLWRRVFDETQEFATSDASRFARRLKMGMTWLSADELARFGIKESLGDIPKRVRPGN